LTKLLVPLALIVAGFLGLLVIGIREGGVPEIQAHELATVAPGGETVRMHGILHEIRSNERPLRFVVRDKERPDVLVPVYADKTRPDTFQESYDIAVDGNWDAARGEFVARQILTKCPSKYESEEKAGIGSGVEYERRRKSGTAPAAEPVR
jgi:cytochrome c-type biogenesis protein CcmE